MKKFLTPQVRTFVYGATAALLSVATVQGWITEDLSKAIETSLPTIIGAIATIIAAANVKPNEPKKEVSKPVDMLPVAPQPAPDDIAKELPPA